MRCAIIGHRGFIGSALARKLGEYTTFPTPETDVLFYMGSVVHPDFEKNPDYHFNKVIQDFLFLLPYCRNNNIYFVYPSSALVYEKDTFFARCKKIMELMASSYPNTLGLRIFPVYGPGEKRTVISQWCKQVKDGVQPVVYGDGNQSRDFIYIDDVIDQVLYLVKHRIEGVRDIGTGKLKKFKDILKVIQKVSGKKIDPVYVPAPQDYSEGIFTKNPLPSKVSIEDGIRKILAQS